MAQFSAPILSELIADYTSRISKPEDDDPLVAIRKQELALNNEDILSILNFAKSKFMNIDGVRH